MSISTTLGTRDVIPHLASFAELHPRLRIHLQLGDRLQDLVTNAIDVSMRLGQLPDSTATAKLIGAIPRVVVASPDYLARFGAPDTPSDLVRHRIVGTAEAIASAWRFARGGEDFAIKLEPHFSTDENEGTIAAASAGFGITSTTRWACRRELDSGELKSLLPEWTMPDIPVHAYFPMGRATRAAARAAIEHFSTLFRNGLADQSPTISRLKHADPGG
jgi:DNA-binding transcriptional LysR family regulator